MSNIKTKTIRDVKVVLYLPEDVALWLKGIMQNPFYGQTPDNEKEIDSKNRHDLWDALNDSLPHKT